MTESEAARLKAEGWKPRDLPGFAARFGPLWTRKLEDAWLYGVFASAEHLNPAGLVHGGVLLSLMDHAMSTVAWEAAARRPCVTVQLDSKFLSAARPGQFLVATARVTKQTASLVFTEAEVQQGSTAVARASALLKIVG